MCITCVIVVCFLIYNHNNIYYLSRIGVQFVDEI